MALHLFSSGLNGLSPVGPNPAAEDLFENFREPAVLPKRFNRPWNRALRGLAPSKCHQGLWEGLSAPTSRRCRYIMGALMPFVKPRFNLNRD
jgi:hypothetical protein